MTERWCAKCKAFQPLDHVHPATAQGGLWDAAADAVSTLIEPDEQPRDIVEARAKRDEALSQVALNANAIWRQRFAEVVRGYTDQGLTFTSEDVTAVVGLPPAGSPNAVGAMTRACAIRNGYRKVGRKQATRVNQHATEIAIWGPGGA